MMILGQEVPLCWNKQIYAYDENYGFVKQCRVEDDGLNRYCFVWLGELTERDGKFKNLIRALQDQLQSDANWFLLWKTPGVKDAEDGAESPIPPDPKIDLRTGQGWDVHRGKDLAVAQQYCDMETLQGFAPAGYKRLTRDGGLVLVFGKTPPLPEYTQAPLANTFADFAERCELAPSSPFLSWYRERKLTLIYNLRDHLSHHVLVVVTPFKLNVDSLKEAGLADSVFEGDDAAEVWHYSG